MQLAMQRNGKVSIEANRMAPVSDRGGHDAFKKALMQTFLSAADDPDDMHTKGVRTMRNRTAITSATAAGVVCSGALAERTMKMLKKDLSEEELRAVADIIKRGGLGEFNLADAANERKPAVLQPVPDKSRCAQIQRRREGHGYGREERAYGPDEL